MVKVGEKGISILNGISVGGGGISVIGTDFSKYSFFVDPPNLVDHVSGNSPISENVYTITADVRNSVNGVVMSGPLGGV
jgi:hypothetical protein